MQTDCCCRPCLALPSQALDLVEWVARHVITAVAQREHRGEDGKQRSAVLAGEILLCPFYRCFLGMYES